MGKVLIILLTFTFSAKSKEFDGNKEYVLYGRLKDKSLIINENTNNEFEYNIVWKKEYVQYENLEVNVAVKFKSKCRFKCTITSMRVLEVLPSLMLDTDSN